jgi:hypothetical protein
MAAMVVGAKHQNPPHTGVAHLAEGDFSGVRWFHRFRMPITLPSSSGRCQKRTQVSGLFGAFYYKAADQA